METTSWSKLLPLVKSIYCVICLFNSYGPISDHLPLYFQLESYLLRNQEEYFEFSSRNYTPEQRQYNNSLTQGLLDLASEEGYVFEEFTFSMVRGEFSKKHIEPPFGCYFQIEKSADTFHLYCSTS